MDTCRVGHVQEFFCSRLARVTGMSMPPAGPFFLSVVIGMASLSCSSLTAFFYRCPSCPPCPGLSCGSLTCSGQAQTNHSQPYIQKLVLVILVLRGINSFLQARPKAESAGAVQFLSDPASIWFEFLLPYLHHRHLVASSFPHHPIWHRSQYKRQPHKSHWI